MKKFICFSETNNGLIFEVENSHGDKINNGYLKMTEKWFDQYVYQIATDISYLNLEEKDEYKKEPIMLPIYDSYGTLANL